MNDRILFQNKGSKKILLVGLGAVTDIMSSMISANDAIISKYETAFRSNTQLKDLFNNNLLSNPTPLAALYSAWDTTIAQLNSDPNGYKENAFAWISEIGKKSVYPEIAVSRRAITDEYLQKNPDGTIGITWTKYKEKVPNNTYTQFKTIANTNRVVSTVNATDALKQTIQYNKLLENIASNADAKTLLNSFGQEKWNYAATAELSFDDGTKKTVRSIINEYTVCLANRTNFPLYGPTIINAYQVYGGRNPNATEFTSWMNSFSQNPNTDIITGHVNWFSTHELDRSTNPFSPQSDYYKFAFAAHKKYGGNELTNASMAYEVKQLLKSSSPTEYINSVKGTYQTGITSRASNPYSPQNQTYQQIIDVYNQYSLPVPSRATMVSAITQILEGTIDPAALVKQITSTAGAKFSPKFPTLAQLKAAKWNFSNSDGFQRVVDGSTIGVIEGNRVQDIYGSEPKGTISENGNRIDWNDDNYSVFTTVTPFVVTEAGITSYVPSALPTINTANRSTDSVDTLVSTSQVNPTSKGANIVVNDPYGISNQNQPSSAKTTAPAVVKKSNWGMKAAIGGGTLVVIGGLAYAFWPKNKPKKAVK